MYVINLRNHQSRNWMELIKNRRNYGVHVAAGILNVGMRKWTHCFCDVCMCGYKQWLECSRKTWKVHLWIISGFVLRSIKLVISFALKYVLRFLMYLSYLVGLGSCERFIFYNFVFDIQQLLFGDYSLANSCLLATGCKDKEQPSRKRKKLLTC